VTDHDYWVNRRVILVACVRPAGTLADLTFSVAYANERNLGADPGSVGAYLMADLPSATAAYAPLPSRSFNSEGGGNQIQRSGIGVYVVRLGRLAGRYAKSTVLVTARGPGGAHCKVSSWLAPAPDVVAIVTCFDVVGAAVDSQFFLTFLTDGPP
jgi:hypothetical protein